MQALIISFPSSFLHPVRYGKQLEQCGAEFNALGFQQPVSPVAEQLAKIFGGDPHNRHQTIEEPGINMLKTVKPVPLLMRRKPEDLPGIYVFIHTMDISK